jgi:hypothetical protein
MFVLSLTAKPYFIIITEIPEYRETRFLLYLVLGKDAEITTSNEPGACSHNCVLHETKGYCHHIVCFNKKGSLGR